MRSRPRGPFSAAHIFLSLTALVACLLVASAVASAGTMLVHNGFRAAPDGFSDNGLRAAPDGFSFPNYGNEGHHPIEILPVEPVK